MSAKGFISMYPPPRWPIRLSEYCGTCPRGAGGTRVLNGAAFSPPEYISPSSCGGSQPGSPQNSALNGTPHDTSQL
ncbi:Uncharacterised protein [Mycobacteroides abscessus subsp. abscessus]|nr:Uncharacterised protein [Mycobacteroides abscessus subsp. abscessus]